MFAYFSRKISRHFLKNENGVVTVLSLFLVTALLIIFGLSVDYANGIRLKAQMQAAADAAALAAAIDLPDKNLATKEGLSIAKTNLPTAEHGGVVISSDFEYGQWDSNQSKFNVGGEPYNAVRVTANRNNNRNNPMGTYMLKLAGVASFNVSASSIALARPDDSCEDGGFFSADKIYSGSNNNYLNGFCLYGNKGVKVSSDNSFETGVKVAMSNLSDLEKGGKNKGLSDALIENTYSLVLPSLVSGTIKDMENGTFSGLPSFITFGPVKLDKIEDKTKLQENTLYIVKDVADLGSDKTRKNIAIVAKKEVKVGSNNTLHNVVFATHDKILFGSNNEIGLNTYCNSGEFNSYIFSSSNIEFGSNNTIRGVQMASREEIKLGSELGMVEGVHAEALGAFDYGSADNYSGCAGRLKSSFANPQYNNSAYVSFALIR